MGSGDLVSVLGLCFIIIWNLYLTSNPKANNREVEWTVESKYKEKKVSSKEINISTARFQQVKNHKDILSSLI